MSRAQGVLQTALPHLTSVKWGQPCRGRLLAPKWPPKHIKGLNPIPRIEALTCDVTVEVLHRYSNRPDLYGPLSDVVKRINANDQTNDPGVVSMATGNDVTPVRRHLDETGRAEMVESFRAGALIRELVEQYGVGPTTVKRILREAGAQRSRVNQTEVVESFLAGDTIRKLAERHGVSIATIKRTLRRQGVGEKDRKA